MLLCCQNWRTGYASTATTKRTALIHEGCPFSIFGAGYPSCDLAAWMPNAPKMEGESKGGDFPSWHTTFGESLVCYTFCPGWRGKGAARSGAGTFPHQKISPGNGRISWADFGRDKRYIKPPSLVLRPAAATAMIFFTSDPPGWMQKALIFSAYHLPSEDFQRAQLTRPGTPPASPGQVLPHLRYV